MGIYRTGDQDCKGPIGKIQDEKEMTKEQCGRCKLLGAMNTRTGPKDCCRWFYPPEALENVECKHTQYGYGILVEPRMKRKNGKQG